MFSIDEKYSICDLCQILLKEDEYLGELLVSLTYLPQAERLNVGIVEARNLKALSTHIEAGKSN